MIHPPAVTACRSRPAVLVAVAALACTAANVCAVRPDPVLTVRSSRTTGLASFVTAADGGAIPCAGGGRHAPVTSLDFLIEHGHLFGIRDPLVELAVAEIRTDALGHTHTTYEQVHEGVRVFSGIVKVHRYASGEIRAANGDFYPISPKLSTVPSIAAASAASLAAAALSGGWPTVEHNELVIIDPGWYGDRSIGPHLAYHVILADFEAGIREAFFIEAHGGAVLDRWSTVHRALDRAVHDAAGTPDIPGPLARDETTGPTGIADVDAAFDYLGDTYDYFYRGFGRDGMDDAGMTMIATVNSTVFACPNASWSFVLEQIAFCAGTVTDDLVAHEVTHGVTQRTANLIYQNQSGQLNESFSDVFGELVDLFNGDAAFPGPPSGPPHWTTHPTGPGTDTPNGVRSGCSGKPTYPDGVRWLITEDGSAATPFDGAIRDMWGPTCLGNPDRTGSALQTCSPLDAGGVHSGSGIPNHAFAMLTDGKTFNGFTVSGIGPIKAGAVWYRALTTYLTVASDFGDAYSAFNQAAADLIGTAPNDPRTGLPSAEVFTAADAAEVDKALRAVEMDIPGACGESVPVLDSAPPVTCAVREVVFADDFESGPGGWTVSNSSPPTPYDWTLTATPLPFGRAGVAWFCEDRNVGDCSTSGVPEQAIHSLFSPIITLPISVSFPALTFAHFVETEPRWDGGDVKISVNSGAWQPVPRAALTHNPYNTTLFADTQGNTNPVAGELTFSGVGGDWGTSVVDLAPFISGGDTLQVRFDFSKDWCYGLTGWFVDDFEIHHCPAETDCNSNGVPDGIDLTLGPHQPAVVAQPPNHSSGNASDLDGPIAGVNAVAENFLLLRPQTIEAFRIWGGYHPSGSEPNDAFTVMIHQDNSGVPGAVVFSETGVSSTRTATGLTFLAQGVPEWEYVLTLAEPITLGPGGYFVEILNDTASSPDSFYWQRALVGDVTGVALAVEAPGVSWIINPLSNFSLEILTPVAGSDCDFDAIPDECAAPADCNTNGTLDVCDPCGDADGSGVVDVADLIMLTSCLTGPADPATPQCLCMLDADADGDLDLADFASYQRCAAVP